MGYQLARFILYGCLIAASLTRSSSRGLPTVDPGLFVISGVGTCGGGHGYCLLGLDCTLDEDFLPDDGDGHCNGLSSAFTPSAHFVCCRDVNNKTENTPTPDKDPKPDTTPMADTSTESLANTIKYKIVDEKDSTINTEDTDKKKEEINNNNHEYQTRTTNENNYKYDVNTINNDEIQNTAHKKTDDEINNNNENIQYDTTKADTNNKDEMESKNKDDSNDNITENNEDDITSEITTTENTEVENVTNDNTVTDNINNYDGMDSKIQPKVEDTTDEQNKNSHTTLETMTIINMNDYNINNVDEYMKDSMNNQEINEDVKMDNKIELNNEIKVINNENSIKTQTNNPDIISSDSIKMLLDSHKNKFGLVSLASDETYGSDEESVGSIVGIPEREAAASDHVFQYGEQTEESPENIEDNTEPNLNEVPSTLEENPNENFIKTGDTHEPETDQGLQKHVNNEHESITDNIRSGEADIQLNTDPDVATDKRYGMTNEAGDSTESVTTEIPNIVVGNVFQIVSKRPDKSKDPEPPQLTYEEPSTFPPNQDATLAKRCGMSASCISLVRFSYEDKPICYGNPLWDDWVLTSASCALRIFRMGMFNVSIHPDDERTWSTTARVRTIIVHENYRNTENELHLAANNIGLVRIYPGLSWELCSACLPQPNQQFENERCATHPVDASPMSIRLRFDHNRNTAVCEGITETVPASGNFLMLTCPTSSWLPRATPSLSPNIGLPLRCDGILAGVQAGEGIGTRIYTAVSTHLEWIRINAETKQVAPMQTFRRFQ